MDSVGKITVEKGLYKMEEFVLKQLELLELERESEIEETRALHEGVPSKALEQQGLCLRKLRVADMRRGLYGRVLVTFEPEWSGKILPAHSITPGDIVGVGATGDYGHREVVITGVVWSTKSNTLVVAFEASLDNMPIEDRSVYSLVKVANNVTYRRLKSALLDLKNYKGGCASHLIDVLFGISMPSAPLVSISADTPDDGELKFVNNCLDESQRKAVRFALLQKEIAIIHGPPGTGKTTTVVEVICQSVSQGSKVLVCAPSNVAVDNIVEKLATVGVKLVRLGHPARALQTNQNFSLDALLSRSDNYILMKDIQKDMDSILLEAGKSKDKGCKRRLQSEAKSLARELRTREVAGISDVLKAADIVLATLSSAHPHGPLKHVPIDYFDLVVIDECSQALEAACWIPLLRAKKCVFAGDHLQLPPTIISKKAANEGLDVTIMERILKFPYGNSVVQMLATQYRMHEVIMRWSSDQLYGGKLVAASSVKGHLLCDLPNVENTEDTCIPLLLIDTAGCDLYEIVLDDDISKGNEGEARLVAVHVSNLIKSGLDPADIAVIAPYNLQVEMLRELMSTKYPRLEIKSVDGFQGREKEAVILSLTRSNAKREVGFLAEDRRINVAITRARRHLAVICDSETVSHHAFLKELVRYLNDAGEVRSAHQHQDGSAAAYNNHIFTHKQTIHIAKSRLPSSAKLETNSKKELNLHTRPNATAAKLDPVQETVRRSEGLALKYQEILDKFNSDSMTSDYAFSSSLTSFERRLVHEIAEKLNLLHVSQSEGTDRFIVVSKKIASKPENRPNIASAKTPNRFESVTVTSSTLVAENSCPKVEGGSEQVSNCNEDQISDDTEPVVPRVSKHTAKKKKKKCAPSDSMLNKSDSDGDLNAFLVNLARKDNTCNYPKCKTGIAILRQVCSLCQNAFCMQHFLPEVHGCGDLAHARARQRISKEGVITPGSGPNVGQKIDPNKRAHLERKLGKKLSEFGNQRNKKLNASGKSK